MPKITLKDQTIASDIALTYPSNSGTIARIEDIAGSITELPYLSLVNKGSHTLLVDPATFTTVATFATDTLPNNGNWTFTSGIRASKFYGGFTGHRWLVRWINVTTGAVTPIRTIPIYTSPLGTSLYDFLVFEDGFINTSGSNNTISFQVSKDGAGSVSNNFECKVFINKYWP